MGPESSKPGTAMFLQETSELGHRDRLEPGDKYVPTQPEIKEVTGVAGETWDGGVGVGTLILLVPAP